MKNSRKWLHWSALLLWMGVIYLFSAQPNLKSSLPTVWDTILRKGAHIMEYFVLAYFFFLSLRYVIKKSSALMFLGALGSIIYAAMDEFHQTFVFGRSGNFKDVMVDGIGVLLCVILFIRFKKDNFYQDETRHN